MNLTDASTSVRTLPNQDCVHDAAVEIFGSACGLKITPASGAEAAAIHVPAVVATVSLVGQVTWSICLGLQSTTAEAVATKFAGFPIPFDSADMGDAIGEVANQVVGMVKAKLDQRGVKVNISLPSVMRCENPEMLAFQTLPVVRMPYFSPAGVLWIVLSAGNPPVPVRPSGA